MASRLVEISQALETLLNAATLSQGFTTKRLMVPKFALQKEEDTVVFIVASGQNIAPITRDRDTITYRLQLCVYQKIDSSSTAIVDPLLDFTQRVVDLLRANRVISDASMTSINNEASYNPELLSDARTFASVISVEYRELR